MRCGRCGLLDRYLKLDFYDEEGFMCILLRFKVFYVKYCIRFH